MEKQKGMCYICGHELEWNPESSNCTSDDLGDCVREEIVCPECGTSYASWNNLEEEGSPAEGVVINYQGFGRCPYYGGVLVWGCDFMRSDIEGTLDDADDSLLRDLYCCHCGRDFEVMELSANEIKDSTRPFWEEYRKELENRQ